MGNRTTLSVTKEVKKTFIEERDKGGFATNGFVWRMLRLWKSMTAAERAAQTEKDEIG